MFVGCLSICLSSHPIFVKFMWYVIHTLMKLFSDVAHLDIKWGSSRIHADEKISVPIIYVFLPTHLYLEHCSLPQSLWSYTDIRFRCLSLHHATKRWVSIYILSLDRRIQTSASVVHRGVQLLTLYDSYAFVFCTWLTDISVHSVMGIEEQWHECIVDWFTPELDMQTAG